MKKIRDFPGGAMVKNPPSSAGDLGLIPDGEVRSHMVGTTKSMQPSKTSALAEPRGEPLQAITRESPSTTVKTRQPNNNNNKITE